MRNEKKKKRKEKEMGNGRWNGFYDSDRQQQPTRNNNGPFVRSLFF